MKTAIKLLQHLRVFVTLLAIVPVAIPAATPTFAQDAAIPKNDYIPGWRLPGLDTGLTGGLHTVYADRSGSGLADIYAGLSVLSQKDLFAANAGARRIGYRIGGVFAVLDMLEVGVDISGASINGLGSVRESMTSFGDIRLRGKYYKRMHALGFAGIVGYDLLQGVQDRSTLADIATPSVGIGLSYFGRDCKAPNNSRIHLNAVYVYDRTVNFLNGQRTPAEIERFAWQMRDYTHTDIRLGFEYEFNSLLPVVEYEVEIPINSPGSFDPIHTITPGLKFDPTDTLAISLAADIAFGGDQAFAPGQSVYDIIIGLAYRFKGKIVKPTQIIHSTNAEQPLNSAEDVTEPTAPISAPTEQIPLVQESNPASEPDIRPDPNADSNPDTTVQTPTQESQNLTPEPAVETKPKTPVETAPQEKPKKSPGGKPAPIDLNQFAE